jgi:hypothetical protein
LAESEVDERIALGRGIGHMRPRGPQRNRAINDELAQSIGVRQANVADEMTVDAAAVNPARGRESIPQGRG